MAISRKSEDFGELENAQRRSSSKKQSRKAVDSKTAKAVKHTHDLPLQEKLKDKNWDPMKEMLEITDEYEEGTPKREGGKDYWGACCLESQDVDVPQKPKNEKTNKQSHKHTSAQ